MIDLLKIIMSFIAMFLFLAAGSAVSSPRIQVGKPFPGIVLPALEDGSPRSVSSFRGEKLILHIFASW